MQSKAIIKLYDNDILLMFGSIFSAIFSHGINGRGNNRRLADVVHYSKSQYGSLSLFHKHISSSGDVCKL
jgi:hypothetical protein